ncbi:MAG: ArnT family glycosyltransferase [Fimbriimonadales bacterium]
MSGGLGIGSLRKPAVLVPLGLFLASFLLRLVGIGWGLPNALHNQTYHPDELLNYGVSQQLDIAHGNLTPHFYNYGTAYFLAENIAAKVVNAYGGSSGAQGWKGVGRDILVGRILSALAGSGTVVVIWLILRRITTQFGALVGSALMAVAPGFLVHSRFETVDVFATFWLALSALFALRVIGAMPDSMADRDHREPRDMRDALLAGLFAGISMGTKYSGVLVILVLWLALVLTRRPGWWKAVIVGTMACFAAFVLTTPGFFLESDRFWKNFGEELGHSSSGHGLVFIGTPSGFLYHLINLAVGLGIFATIAGIVGLGFGAFRRHKWAVALLVFAAAYYIVIGRAEVKFLRYTFPLLVPLTVAYGYAMGTAFRRKGTVGQALAVVGVFALSGNPLVLDFGGLIGAAQNTYHMVVKDSRDEAAEELERVAANGSVGLVSDPWFYTPPLISDSGLNRDQLPMIYDEVSQASHPRLIRYIPNGDLRERVDWDVRLLTEGKPDYVVFSSFEAIDLERLSVASGLDPGTQAAVDRYKQFGEVLGKQYRQFAGFGIDTTPPIHDLMYIRPTIWVWKRNDLP